MNRTRDLLLAAWLSIGAWFAPVAIFGAQDDEEITPDLAQRGDSEDVDFGLAPENFDSWVFQLHGGAKEARTRLDSQLKLQLNELGGVCNLTAAQQEKLKLAAAIDTKRFFADVEVVRKHFLSLKNNQEAMQEIWPEINPLQQRIATGVHGERSFFAKSMRSILSDDQQQKRRAVVDERTRFHYRASLETTILELDDYLGLTDQQHTALVKLAIERTKPPNIFGLYDGWYVMAQLSKLPEAEMKPPLNERQWKRLSRRLEQFRGYEELLKQQGVMEK